jgi:hypothetical protein
MPRLQACVAGDDGDRIGRAVTLETTVLVPMTQAQRDWHAEQLAWLRHEKPYAFGAIAQHEALVAAYDAAVARPAEPRKGMAEGEVRCTCHGVAVSACPSCGGVVGGGA